MEGKEWKVFERVSDAFRKIILAAGWNKWGKTKEKQPRLVFITIRHLPGNHPNRDLIVKPHKSC